MKTKWLAALMLLASCCAGVPAFAQVPMKPRFVIMDDYIRAILSKDWDAHLHDARILERAYCVRWQYDLWAHEPTYRITQIFAPDSVDADENSIDFFCPKDADVAEIHVHPPSTCYYDDDGAVKGCWYGGPYAWQCAPSDADRKRLLFTKQPFGMVQCTREGTAFYFATGDNR